MGIGNLLKTFSFSLLVFLASNAGAQCADSLFAVFEEANNSVVCKDESNGSVTIRINPLDTFSTSFIIFFDGGPPTVPLPSMNPPGTFTSTFSNLSSGPYEVIVRDNIGCEDTITVTIAEPIDTFRVTISDKGDATCFNNGFIEATNSGGWPPNPTVYTWTGFDNMMNILPGYPADLGFALTGLEGGLYTVEATDIRGCTATASVMLQAFPQFEINILPSGTQVVDLGQSIDMNVVPSSGTNITYQWFPQTFLDILSVDGDSVRSTPCENITYIVLGIDDDRQCSDADSIQISLSGEFDPFVPNIFNPHSLDPRNNEFQAFGIGIVNVDMEIFDRKGALIYESVGLGDAKWNGRIGGTGAEAVAGKYIYSMRIESVCGEIIGKSGGISLMR